MRRAGSSRDRRAAAIVAMPGAVIQYAASFPNVGPPHGRFDREFVGVQSLCIFSNVSSWRGDEARTVKARLKELSK